MIDPVDIDNALRLYLASVDCLEDPEGKLKGVWFAQAKQLDFSLKIANHLGLLTTEQGIKLSALNVRIDEWARNGGVKIDKDGRFI